MGLSHAEFQEQQPEWRVALGAAASIPVPAQGVSAVLPRFLRGIEKLVPLQEPQPEDGKEAGPSAVTESTRKRSRWPSNSRTAVLALTGVLVLTVIGYFIKSWIDRQRLESRLAQVSEFSDSFLMGTAYWSAPPTWRPAAQTRRDRSGIGLIKDRIFRRLQSLIRPPASQPQGCSLDCAGQGRKELLSFPAAGSKGSPPNAFITSFCKDGKLTPLITFPVNQDLSQADDWYHIIVEARGSKISHQIQVSSEPAPSLRSWPS